MKCLSVLLLMVAWLLWQLPISLFPALLTNSSIKVIINQILPGKATHKHISNNKNQTQ